LEAWWNNSPRFHGTPRKEAAAQSIAVLPFVNLNRDKEHDIFSDGLTEELINALAQVEGLRVVARTSAFHFKGKTDDIRAIGSRLGVRTILEGSVRRADDRLRVTAQLINTADGCHLWSRQYDRRLQDVFELQEGIARAVVDELRIRFAGNRITRQHSSDPETYTVYLEGLHQWNRRTRPGILKAVECFQRVLSRDAGMAPAWAGLANCYAMLPAYGDMTACKALHNTRDAVRKALAIDENLAEAHVALAFATAVYEFDWSSAESHFRRGLDLNPNYAYAHLLYSGVVLGPTGRLEEALIRHQRASELDPISAVTAAATGACWLMLGQFEEAISACERALTIDATHPWAYRWLGEAWFMKGMYDQAEDAFSKIAEPVFAAGFLGSCYARTNREPLARKLLRQLEDQSASCPMLAIQPAVLRLVLGDVDGAFGWLHKACDAHATGVHWLNVEPVWDILRPDSRFADVLRRLRLAD
ncbi:MAG: tetratricopeptide repeat protein, partial [Bryobacterales bacterium]|nr:tetratricopeptide repeat protein [Bryobacterales bacterium]